MLKRRVFGHQDTVEWIWVNLAIKWLGKTHDINIKKDHLHIKSLKVMKSYFEKNNQTETM